MNPNDFVTLAPGLTLGAGPGVGYVAAHEDASNQGLWSVQASANLSCRHGALFLGAGARYQATRDKRLASGVSGTDNVLLGAKAGFNF